MKKSTLKEIEKAGNNTDTVVGHLTKGEVIIPVQLFEVPEVKKMLKSAFADYGISLNEFIVGNPENKINLETGYPEFNFFQKAFNWAGNTVRRALGISDGKKEKEKAKQAEKKAAEDRAKQEKEMRDRIDAQARDLAQQKADAQTKQFTEEQERLQKAKEEERKRMAEAETRGAQTAASVANQNATSFQPSAITNPATNLASQSIGAKQQAASTAGYSVPTTTSATNFGPSAAVAAALNEETGGKNAPVNQFKMPNTTGLTFGGA